MDRAEAIFAFWLEHRVYYKYTFTEYRRLCDEGKVAGFEIPGSDTVTGNTTGSEGEDRSPKIQALSTRDNLVRRTREVGQGPQGPLQGSSSTQDGS